MIRDILLARRLLEAVADPEAPRVLADDAGAELAEISARVLDEHSGLLPLVDFEGLRADDLSAHAWLLLLTTRGKADPELPAEILEAIFADSPDPVFRFRLISGALAHPMVEARFQAFLAEASKPYRLEELPDCWPSRHLAIVEESGEGAISEDGSQSARLAEFVLYLLQEGSGAALALAAAAIAPDQPWREPALQVARAIVRTADPTLSSYGKTFEQTPI